MTVENTTDLCEFYKMLVGHDWFFEMSDDSRIYHRGKNERGKLLALAKRNGAAFEQLYRDYHMFVWGRNSESPANPCDNTQATTIKSGGVQ